MEKERTETIRCEDCKGRGTNKEYIIGGKGKTHQVDCNQCNGSGYLTKKVNKGITLISITVIILSLIGLVVFPGNLKDTNDLILKAGVITLGILLGFFNLVVCGIVIKPGEKNNESKRGHK